MTSRGPLNEIIVETAIGPITLHDGVNDTMGFSVVMNRNTEDGVTQLVSALCAALDTPADPVNTFVAAVRDLLQSDSNGWLFQSNGETFYPHGMLFDWPAQWCVVNGIEGYAVVYWSSGRLKVANMPMDLARAVCDRLRPSHLPADRAIRVREPVFAAV